ncbi:protein phosphatase 2C domain-containing protein [Stieleria sp. TO1_6]|uniref:protein phosphatase 2C domain-containing protein n=1 Tax=Stieleria tagensis TaxID=2956795 RepID=UPI00209AB35B|nr:protein phosphatase 2C domain-containing protein [Stieleria tagensis]MCO8121947.1 protein phosphatase 2C domain-containing protein [Stieleria tagensis]
MRRTNNQDSHAVLTARTSERFQSRGHLFIVADGMGAHAAGELASSMATELIAMNYFRTLIADSKDSLHVAVHEANAEIYQRGQQNPEFHNMGTTASSLVLLSTGAVVAHVGDSRVYRLRKGVLEQLTFDHSLVWEVQASGQVHPDSALGQALPKNVITRSLGPNADVQIDIEGPYEIQAGDRFLLCSDGLSGQVDDVEIATLLDCLPEDLVVEVLVDLANLRGGPDNTTVVVTTVTEGPLLDQKTAPPKPTPDESMAFWGIIGAVVATLLGVIGMVLFWFIGSNAAMVISLVAALIGGVITATSYSNMKQQSRRRKSSGGGDACGVPKPYGGNGPYRRYLSKPDQTLFDRLGQTVAELRAAAKQKNWLMDWKDIDTLQEQGAAAIESGDGKSAIHLQAKAIVETMHQLREQHNRSADETAIDQ